MKTPVAALAALILTGALALVGCSGTVAPSATIAGDGSPSASTTDVNSADIMFTHMMIPHHQQAIEMADMVLAQDGIDDAVRLLAEDIKAAQQPEIDQMEGWLTEWGAGSPDMGSMGHGDGMMSHQDMAALEAATGEEASRLFLEQMIVHHEGAIEMARSELDGGRNAAVSELAQRIMQAQTDEIAMMHTMLAER